MIRIRRIVMSMIALWLSIVVVSHQSVAVQLQFPFRIENQAGACRVVDTNEHVVTAANIGLMANIANNASLSLARCLVTACILNTPVMVILDGTSQVFLEGAVITSFRTRGRDVIINGVVTETDGNTNFSISIQISEAGYPSFVDGPNLLVDTNYPDHNAESEDDSSSNPN
jgi:hypothetical protein